MATLNERREVMKLSHARERERLDKGIEARRQAETLLRVSRLQGGVRGLWDRLTGERGRVQALNAAEALQGVRRDRSQRDTLVRGQLDERRELQNDIRQLRQRYAATLLGLHRPSALHERPRHGGREPTLGPAADDEARQFGC